MYILDGKRYFLPVYVMLMGYSMGMIHGHGTIVRDSQIMHDIISKHVDKHLMETGRISS
jgi:hypothetical protein